MTLKLDFMVEKVLSESRQGLCPDVTLTVKPLKENVSIDTLHFEGDTVVNAGDKIYAIIPDNYDQIALKKKEDDDWMTEAGAESLFDAKYLFIGERYKELTSEEKRDFFKSVYEDISENDLNEKIKTEYAHLDEKEKSKFKKLIDSKEKDKQLTMKNEKLQELLDACKSTETAIEIGIYNAQDADKLRVERSVKYYDYKDLDVDYSSND